MNVQFGIRETTFDSYLGFQIEKHSDGLVLHQKNYIKRILKRFNMDACNSVTAPTALHSIETERNYQEWIDQFKSVIGSLMYAAIKTRPDICFSVCMAARAMSKPLIRSVIAVKRILRYLKGKEHYGILLRNKKINEEIIVYCDADYGGDSETSESTTGSIFLYNAAPFYWRSSRQKVVANSSSEAEYISLHTSTQDICWIRK